MVIFIIIASIICCSPIILGLGKLIIKLIQRNSSIKCSLCDKNYIPKKEYKNKLACPSCIADIMGENKISQETKIHNKDETINISEENKEIIVSEPINITINEKIWSNFVNEKLLINCETEQEAKEFCLYCHKKGYKWYFDDKGDNQLINNSRWNTFKEKSFYSPYLTGIHCGSIDNIMKQYKNNIVKYKDIIKEPELPKEINIHNKDEPKPNKIIINKIHWNYFLNGNIAVNCEIKQEAKEFLDYCHSKGLKWVNGDPLIGNNYWNVNKEKTSYRYDKKRNGLNYSDIMFYKNYKKLEITKYNNLKNKELKEIK